MDEKKNVACRVRAPFKEEMPQVRKLVPRAFRGRRPPKLFVAVSEDTGQVIGVVVARGRQRREAPPVFLFWIVVQEACRRNGVGTALLHALIKQCKEVNPDSVIRAARAIVEGSPADAFVRRSAFEPVSRVHHFETGVQDYRSILVPLREKLVERKKIPAEMRLLQLRDASVDAVRDFVVQYFGGNPRSIGMRLMGEGGMRFSRNQSVVLLLDQRVIGVVLVQVNKGVAHVPVNIVDPAFRGGWANVVLKLEVVDRILEQGVEKVFFAANERAHRDTLKLGKRVHGKLASIRTVYRRRLGVS